MLEYVFGFIDKDFGMRDGFSGSGQGSNLSRSVSQIPDTMSSSGLKKTNEPRAPGLKKSHVYMRPGGSPLGLNIQRGGHERMRDYGSHLLSHLLSAPTMGPDVLIPQNVSLYGRVSGSY